MLPSDLRSEMQRAGAHAYPNESCGFVIKVGKKSVIMECKNIAEHKTQQFRIASDDYIKASDRGEIIGVWHTHVDIPPTPSEADKAACEASELPWYIISVRRVSETEIDAEYEFSDVVVVEPSGFEMPYLERPYVFGVFDCYSLVVDYHKREFGIQLGSYPHIDNWFNLGYDFFTENFAKEGFEVVEGDPKVGDVFLIQAESKVPNHVAIYIGNEMILHQMHGRLSKRDIYGGYWQKHTVFHLRNRRLNDAN